MGFSLKDISAQWIRILAVLGGLLLLERTATWFEWTHYPDRPFSIIGNFGQETTVFEKTPATDNSSSITKALVVASLKREHTGWVNNKHFPDWEINTYVTDDPKADLTVLDHTGRESSVYLTYIINHYYSLPDIVVFLHAGRFQWHNDDPYYDGIPPIKNLRIEHVQNEGYASLRCPHAPQCPVGIRPDPKGKDGFWESKRAYADAFRLFFPNDTLPKVVATKCCAQFAVSREAIMARPPADYEGMRQWLWKGGVGDYKSGQIFELMWHYIFGKPAVHCPPADECYCKTFGHCDLKCPNAPGRCQGRFQPPPPASKGFPKGWPEKGLGTHGYVKEKWWQDFYPPDKYDDNMKLWNGSRTPDDVYPTEKVDLSTIPSTENGDTTTV